MQLEGRDKGRDRRQSNPGLMSCNRLTHGRCEKAVFPSGSFYLVFSLLLVGDRPPPCCRGTTRICCCCCCYRAGLVAPLPLIDS